jgi:hypothetical protein
MRKSTTTTSLCVSIALLGLVSAAQTPIKLAASDDCQRRCQAVENQCRLSSKDLDSSKCSAKFLACLQSCRK